MTGISQTLDAKFINQFNWLQASLPTLAQQSLVLQRDLLETSLNLIYAPFLLHENKLADQKDEFSAKLYDPALSFTTAVETAEPLFDMLNEDV